jgi:hypothetical protein
MGSIGGINVNWFKRIHKIIKEYAEYHILHPCIWIGQLSQTKYKGKANSHFNYGAFTFLDYAWMNPVGPNLVEYMNRTNSWLDEMPLLEE